MNTPKRSGELYMSTEPFKPGLPSGPLCNALEKKLGRFPTMEEVRALQFIQTNYRRDWRKRYSRSLADFMAAIPKGQNPEVWRAWYFAPYGVPEWNQHIAIARRILAGETP